MSNEIEFQKIQFAEFMSTIQEMPVAGRSQDSKSTPSHYGTSPDSLRECQDGERTEHLVRLVGMWIGRSYQINDVIALALAWNSRNKPPLDEMKVTTTCYSILATHERKHGVENHPSEEIRPLFSIKAYSAGRFLDKEPPPRRWLFIDILPSGKVAIIVAPGGTGKSNLLLQAGVSVATGIALLGIWKVGEVGGVLMLLAEDDEDEIHRRVDNIIRQQGLFHQPGLVDALRKNLIVKSMVAESNLMTETNITREVVITKYVECLIATAKQIPNLKLIIFDPASRFRGGDENSAQDTTRFVEAIERVAKATGATVLFAHHTNKGSSQAAEASQNASRGSSALTDGVRWQMNLAVMTKEESANYAITSDDRHNYLTAAITKNNYAAPQPVIVLKRGDGGFLQHVELTSKREQKTQDVKSKIVELVAEEAKARRFYSKTSFEAEFGGTEGPLGIGKVAVRNALKELVTANKLTLKSGKLGHPLKAKLATATT